MKRDIYNAVLVIPSHSTFTERQAHLDSLTIATLEPLSLINAHLANALAYFNSKKSMIESGGTKKVCFIDMGLSSFSLSLVEFSDAQVKVLYVKTNRNIGARNIDNNLC